MKKVIFTLLILLILTACKSSIPEKIQLLEQQNKDLNVSLQTTQNYVTELEKQNTDLAASLDVQNNISNALGKEKEAHVKKSLNLQQNIRSFLKSQMSIFREFSQNSDLLDYIGGELIERKKLEDKDLALVDLRNRIPSGGTLLGTCGYFSSPCRYLINILRKANDEWFVVWQAGPFDVSGTQKQTFDFRVPVSVEKGDVVAYAFQGSGNIAGFKSL